MSQGIGMVMGKSPQASQGNLCLGRAMAAEWRRAYPQNTAGCIARDIGVTKKAAENLLNGHFSSSSMGRIIAAYGAGWVAERVLEAAGSSLQDYIEKQAELAEETARQARVKAHEARKRLERYQAAVRSRAGDDSSGPDLSI